MLLLSAVSCDEVGQVPEPEPEVLSFESLDQFQRITKGIASMPQEEFENWEKASSFKSYRSVLIDADTEWATIDNEEKEAVFLDKYKDVLSLQDDALVPHIKAVMYQSIINRQGIYRTGDHFHKVLGDFIVSVKKEDYNKLTAVRLVDGVPDTDGVRVFRYTDTGFGYSASGRTKTSCSSSPYYKEDEYFYNMDQCKDDRKAFISVLSYVSLFTGYGDFNGTWRYGDFYQEAGQIRVWGTRRMAITCNFNSYSNPLQWQNVTYKAFYPHILGYGADQTWFEMITTPYSPYQVTINVPNFSSGGGLTQWTENQYFGPVIFNTPLWAEPFSYIRAEGKSQGIGNNWAIVLCQ